MHLHSKIISEHQSVTCLDIPSQLLTVTNVSISQRKRMIAPGACCTAELIIIGLGIGFGLTVIGGVAMCICYRRLQEKKHVRVINVSQADTGVVCVTTMPIADAEVSSIHANEQDTVIQISADTGETPSPKRHRRHHHHRRRDKEDTVIQISTETSEEGNASPGFVGDI